MTKLTTLASKIALGTILITSMITYTTVSEAQDLLVKLATPNSAENTVRIMTMNGLKAEKVFDQWIRVNGNIKTTQFNSFFKSSAVAYVQPNFKLNTYSNPAIARLKKNPEALAAYIKQYKEDHEVSPEAKPTDNPAIPEAPAATTGADPLFNKQWGMIDIGVQNAWLQHPGTSIIVAVIDTGVDYTHEDLAPNMWRNINEVADNGLDDDGNGFIDDIVGWDFLSNDNKPYDLASSDLGDLLNGGNPGHGTHCAGNVAATGTNGKGISGVAPKAKIMALRFIGDEGGTTAGAIGSIRYAVDNGAKVLSNSWGSEGEDPSEAEQNLALQEAIQYAESKNVLFIAAAGNSSRNNDTDSKKAIPASYPFENIISVAAIDSANKLASFSNYGATTVDLGAPGVKIFSTVPGNKYSDTVIELFGAFWDGTSMACPHVAGAAALYWSAHPEKSYQEVKAAILNSTKKLTTLESKVLTAGKLSVEELMKNQ